MKCLENDDIYKKFEKYWQDVLKSTLPIINSLAIKNSEDPNKLEILMPIYIESIHSKLHKDMPNSMEYKVWIEQMLNDKILNSYDYDEDYFILTIIEFISDHVTDIQKKSIEDEITFDDKIFSNLYHKYVSLLYSSDNEYIILCPLINFDSEVDEINLDDKLIIRKFN